METIAPETRANNPNAEEEIVKRVREWLARAAPMIAGGVAQHDRMASLKVMLFLGEVTYLDDETPVLNARFEEKVTEGDVEGWWAP